MATVTKPIALNESFVSTELTPRTVADILAEELPRITGRDASQVSYDNTASGLTASDVQDALDEIVGDIPTVNDGTLTIQQNGVTKASFSANTASNVTADIEIPTADEKTATDEFTTANGGLLSECNVTLTPVQDLHGYDHPWVGGAGKNLFPLTVDNIKTASGATWVENKTTLDGIEFEILTDDGNNVMGIKITRVSASGANVVLKILNTTQLAVVENKSVIMNGTPAGTNSDCYLAFYAYDGTNQITLQTPNSDSSVFTPSNFNSNTVVRFVVKPNANPDGMIFTPMLRLSTESDATFQPYSNICPISGHTEVDLDVKDGDNVTQHTYQVQIGSTVYGGTLDVVSGVLTVDKVGVSMNGSESWNTHGAISHGFYCDNVIPSGLLMDSTKDDTAISNEYNQNRYDVATSMDNGKFAYGLTGGTVRRFILRDDRFSTVADLTTALGTTNLQLVMELATPTSIQLSPTMVKALVGENHLSAPLEGQEITESKYKQMFTFDDVIAYIQSLS